MIRVLVAEDDGLLRAGIIRLLEGSADIEVVGGCATSRSSRPPSPGTAPTWS